ncbi:unnamed protein product [Symbiodinium sp. CCMP2456]|nr:unnamed protein product [Symbiodinium sp. CCMP2456]
MSAIQASSPHRVFLRGLPLELADRSTLQNICSAFGDVEDAWVRVVDRTSGLHESWSFVQFATGGGATSAAEAGQNIWERVAQAQGLQIDASSIKATLLQSQKHAEGEVVAESAVLDALEAEDVGNFDFESFRERFSMWLGRPVLRRDAEIVFKVLHEHRPDATVHGILRSAKDIRHHDAPAGTDILLVMAYSANYAPGAVCQRVNYEYSRRHGYGFKCEVLTQEDMLAAISPRDAFTWYKVLLLKRELSTETYKYVVWLDGDAAILDQDKSFESFIHQAKGRHLILQEDLSAECRVNCGVMIFRRSNWTLTLLRLLWEGNLSRRHHCKPYYEQSALVRLLVEAKELPARPSTARLQRPWHSDKVCLLPLRSLQTNRLREVQLTHPDKSFIFHPLFASEQFAEDKAIRHFAFETGLELMQRQHTIHVWQTWPQKSLGIHHRSTSTDMGIGPDVSILSLIVLRAHFPCLTLYGGIGGDAAEKELMLRLILAAPIPPVHAAQCRRVCAVALPTAGVMQQTCRSEFICDELHVLTLAWQILLRGNADEVHRIEGRPLLLLDKAARLRDKVCKRAPVLQEQWDQLGVETVCVVVRGMSGEIILEEPEAKSRTPVKHLVTKIRAMADTEAELVQICLGTTVLKHCAMLGDFLVPDTDKSMLELTFLKLLGPAVTVEALTGREIKLLDSVPSRGDRCHFDRSYRFISLGSFADKPSMRYVMTSNDDKGTPSDEAMWRLNVRMPVIVYLNFRSEMHVRYVRKWLQTGDWTRSTQMESTVTSGIPNGPYSGPVFFKAVSDGLLDLRGSDCGEGTYFVFIDTEPDLS